MITVLDHTQYSADIYFLHQSTVRLPVHGCTNTHGVHVKKQAKHTNDSCSESKLLRLIVRSSTHQCPENLVVKLGVQSSIMSRLPRHLVQVLNAGTVPAYSIMMP